MNDKPIVINPQAIILLEKGSEITLSVDAKKELEKILYIRKLIEDVYTKVQDKLTDEMNDRKLKKIVAGNIVISKRFFGERWEISDKDNVEEKFTKLITYEKPNADEIQKYIEVKGELPKGISLKERSEKVSILQREDE